MRHRVAADRGALRRERVEVVPVEEDVRSEGMPSVGPVGDHEDRPGDLELLQQWRGIARHAGKTVVEGDREVARAAAASMDIFGGYEVKTQRQRRLDMTAQGKRAHVVDAPRGRADRVVAQNASLAAQRPATQ